MKLVNRAKMATATTGTGTLTLGAAVVGYQTFAAAGVVDTDVVRYVVEDGADWEIGTGTYTASGTTLSRTVSESSNSGSPINLSGNAVVYVTAVAADIDTKVSVLPQTFTDSEKLQGRTNLGIDPPVFSRIIRITTSGNYTPTAGTREILVKLVGGGAGGRGTSGTSGGTGITGGGGGAGGYAEKFILVSALTVPETVTIGAGGAGGAVGGFNGGTGGTTSFGSHLSATGGSSGSNSGGTGGIGSGGDINVRGGSGESRHVAENNTAYSGRGGDSRFAGGGNASPGTAAGNPGALGSGGAGGRNNNAGGAGGDGYVEIWEFV